MNHGPRVPRTLQTVDRALSVLKAFDAQTPSLGITELSRRLKLNKSTLFPIIKTLEIRGFLEQDPSSLKYRLGPQLYHLGQLFFNSLPIRDVARPWAQQLSDEFDESVLVATMTGRRAAIVIQLLRDRPTHVPTGAFAVFHCTAVGKAILAFQPSEIYNQIVERIRLPRYTPKTITDQAAFLDELNCIRTQGYAVDDEETSPGLRCVAAPIRGAHGTVVASISLSGTTLSVPHERVPVIAARVIYYAGIIARELGYRPLELDDDPIAEAIQPYTERS